MDEFYSKLSKVTVGVLISGIFGLMMNVMLGRLLSGSEYGTFRLFFSSVLMVGGFLSFGLERRTASLMARKDYDSRIASRMSGMGLIFISILGIISLILSSYLELFLGGKIIFASFISSTALYIFYKYSMGVFKGLRREETLGFLNIVIGIFKLAAIILVFYLGYSSTEISVLITMIYLSMVLVSICWLRDKITLIIPSRPNIDDFRSVAFSSSVQIGVMIVLQSAPIIVDLIGGNITQAGIIGAAFTVSLIPFYAYRALIHVILPEVSDLRSKGEFQEISSRVGLFTLVTSLGITIWSALGYLAGPSILRAVYGAGFEIIPTQGFLIFATSGVFLLASFFTEVLIGFGKEKSIAKTWILPLGFFLMLLDPFSDAITMAAAVIFLYIFVSTLILAFLVVKNGIKIWELDLSRVLWEKLR